jgi:hypothetical protein
MKDTMLAEWIERRPLVGIFTSFAGFGTSIIGFLHIGTLILGFAGAGLGFVAGIYTFLIKRAHWHRIKDDSQPPDDPYS